MSQIDDLDADSQVDLFWSVRQPDANRPPKLDYIGLWRFDLTPGFITERRGSKFRTTCGTCARVVHCKTERDTHVCSVKESTGGA